MAGTTNLGIFCRCLANWKLRLADWKSESANYWLTRSLGALRAPTSSWRPFRPLDFVPRALRPLGPVCRAPLRSGLPFLAILDDFRPFWPFWMSLDHFGPFGTVWMILDHFDHFWRFWLFLASLTIFINFYHCLLFSQFSPFWTIWDHFRPFWPFSAILTFF